MIRNSQKARHASRVLFRNILTQSSRRKRQERADKSGATKVVATAVDCCGTITAQECGRGVSRDYDRNSSEATQALLLYRTICKLSRTFSSLTPFSFNFARQPTVLYATYVRFERIRMGLIYYFDSCFMAWDRSQNVLRPILIFLKGLKTRKI